MRDQNAYLSRSQEYVENFEKTEKGRQIGREETGDGQSEEKDLAKAPVRHSPGHN